MSNQQQSQTPPGQHQVPDHRLEELQSRLRQIELQNQQLRGHIDAITQRQAPAAQTKTESKFSPEVVQELTRIIEDRLNPLKSEIKNDIGMVYDATDEAKFKLQYSDPRYAKYHDKVERVRQDVQAQGRWISREQALQMVYFEETGKKPAPEATPAPAPKAPVFDPYLQTYVDPNNGQQFAQGESMPPQNAVGEIEQQQAPAQQQYQAAPAWQQPVQQQQRPVQQQAAYSPPPAGFRPEFGQLPQQGVNQAMSPDHQRNFQSREISLESSDAELEAFEKKYGDIPL